MDMVHGIRAPNVGSRHRRRLPHPRGILLVPGHVHRRNEKARVGLRRSDRRPRSDGLVHGEVGPRGPIPRRERHPESVPVQTGGAPQPRLHPLHPLSLVGPGPSPPRRIHHDRQQEHRPGFEKVQNVGAQLQGSGLLDGGFR